MKRDNRLRVGVIGVGSMGVNHARVYASLPDVHLVGVADAEQETAERVAATYGCTSYADYRRLLDAGVDAVSVAVPTSMHLPVCLAALERGVHTLVEKPIAECLESGVAIKQAAEKSDCVLTVGHVERFNPAVRYLASAIERGELGKVISLSATRVGPFNRRIGDVGVILDLAPHDIDIMSHIVGARVEHAYATCGTVRHPHEDHAIIVLSFCNGGVGVIETNWLTPRKIRSLSVVGSQAVGMADYIAQTVTIVEETQIRQPHVVTKEPLTYELADFADCVRTGTTPTITAADGIHALEVALAAQESARTGQAITLPLAAGG